MNVTWREDAPGFLSNNTMHYFENKKKLLKFLRLTMVVSLNYLS